MVSQLNPIRSRSDAATPGSPLPNNCPNYCQRYTKENVRPAVAAYCDLASRHGLAPAAMALAFVASREFVASTIIGATTLEQLRDNIAACATVLSPEVLAGIETLHLRYTNPAP